MFLLLHAESALITCVIGALVLVLGDIKRVWKFTLSPFGNLPYRHSNVIQTSKLRVVYPIHPLPPPPPPSKNSKPTLIATTESKLEESVTETEFDIDCYTTIQNDRT